MDGSSPTSDLDTLTLARVYLDQGKVDEAAAIYDRLIGSACGDASRIIELRDVVERSLADAAAARRRAGEPPALLPDRLGRDQVVLVPLGPGRLLCTWEATPRGRAAAAAQLAGRTGALTLRLVATTPGDAPAGGAGRATSDLALAVDAGELVADAPRTGGFVCAAVGLRAPDGAFAPIAHSDVLTSPATSAAAGGSPVLLEVEPARGGLDHEPPAPRVVEP